MFILKNLNIEAKRTGSIVILSLKETKKSELLLFFKTKGKKRKGSIVNYRSFAIPISACCKEETGALYSEAEPIKGRRNWSPALSRLHSILQATSLRRTVYTRTKSATTTHV